MPFQLDVDQYFEVIFAPAIVEAGLVPLRADQDVCGGPIISTIWEMVSESDSVLADISLSNPNVFYEIGIAHAIGKPVCLVASDAERVPFDISHLHVTKYRTSRPGWDDDLRVKITKRLREVSEDPTRHSFFPFPNPPTTTTSPEHLDYSSRRQWSNPALGFAQRLLEERSELTEIRLLLGDNGRQLIAYLVGNDIEAARSYLAGFGFPVAKREYLLEYSSRAVEYILAGRTNPSPKWHRR